MFRFLKAFGSAIGTKRGIFPATAKYWVYYFHFFRIFIFKSLIALHAKKLGHNICTIGLKLDYY